MEKLKDIVLIGFAVVGFISILSGFTEQQVYGTPESHIYEIIEADSKAFRLNKVTGEVALLNNAFKGNKIKGLNAHSAKELKYGETDN